MEEILSNLHKRYDCSDPIYLSDFFQPGGDQRLYNKLKHLHQAEFEDRYRIVVVQDCSDRYHYADMPGEAVTALQKYLSQIDISNFFVLLVTSNCDIQGELELARTYYSADDCTIQAHIVDDLPTVGIATIKQDTFCVLPWIHLYVGTDGNMLPCCLADQQFPVGNIQEQSIDTIMKSDQFNQIRSNMLNGLRSKECSRCYQQEDAGIASQRQYHNKQWTNINVINNTIDKFEPKYLDIRLNNICNLKCRMCSGYFSSAIAQEEAELFDNPTSVQQSLKLQQRKDMLPELLKYLPSVEKIYFAGGEPLITGEHYEILNALIACGNTDLEITYNTNFTTLEYRSTQVLDLWKQFTNISVGASLDAHGSVAEYVRHGTNWGTIESNLSLLQEQCPHVNFTVMSTAGLLNIQSLIELQQTWHNSKKLNISKFAMSIMVGPDHLTVRVLPKHHKERLESLIRLHIQWCLDNRAKELADQWQKLLNYMWSEDHSHYLDEFKRLTTLMDFHRKESLSVAIPELGDLL